MWSDDPARSTQLVYWPTSWTLIAISEICQLQSCLCQDCVTPLPHRRGHLGKTLRSTAEEVQGQQNETQSEVGLNRLPFNESNAKFGERATEQSITR